MFPKKQYGRNFLKDPSTAKMIVDRSTLTAEDVVLEIGPGLGALTVPAARQAKHVYAVEKDLIWPGFSKRNSGSEYRQCYHHQQDVLTVDINAISCKGKSGN
ncbi:MAG: rRNA adenine N-6-methyltransferase family protein [Desulfobacterales bacterium]